MKYTTLGNTGLVVSRLAFGAMTFGVGELVAGVRNCIDLDTAERMVSHALDAGVNLFDTADAYLRGESERILGRALGDRRDRAIVATKVGFRSGDALTDTGLSYRHIIASAEASLKRLGTDYIDLYQLHIPDPLTPYEETIDALDDLVRRGMVRYVGFSNFPAWKAARMLGIQEANGYAPFISAQMYYSLLGRDIEREIVPFAEDAGLGILVWSPLASGFLTGKYAKGSLLPEDARRKKFQFPPVDLELGYKAIELLRKIATERGASIAQVAIAWILSKSFISSILVGANKMSHLEDNLQAIDMHLDSGELRELDELTAPQPTYPGWMQGMSWDGKLKEALGV